MRKFYLSLWLYWAFWVGFYAVAAAALLALLATAATYLVQGAASLTPQRCSALADIAWFWFAVSFNAGLLLGLIAGIHKLFSRCFFGWNYRLLDCQGEESENMPMKLWLKLWRKWFFALIWVVAVEIMVAALAGMAVGIGLKAWFSVYWLYVFVFFAGLPLLVVMPLRCKMVKVAPC